MIEMMQSNRWRATAARLIVATACAGGLSAVVGCDTSQTSQVASLLSSGGANSTVSSAEPASKQAVELRLSSNHNETFVEI